MYELQNEFKKSIYKFNFKRPIFNILILFCDQEVSIERQLKRGLKTKTLNEINQQIENSKELLEERATDFE
jgi:dephospho-CoA kinase